MKARFALQVGPAACLILGKRGTGAREKPTSSGRLAEANDPPLTAGRGELGRRWAKGPPFATTVPRSTGLRLWAQGNPGHVLRIGCSGWSYAHWRGVLYPEHGSTGAWLSRYAEHFDTVEVNATFHRLPTRQSVERWAKVTPDTFCFAVKASRYLTHVKRLQGLDDGMRRLEERIGPMRSTAKLGPILWQLPASFRRDDERLASALEALPAGRHAFEFRHESWFAEDVYGLLRTHRVALVVADRAPAAASPCVPTTDWWYIRFHSGRGRNGVYTSRQLAEWAERIAALRGDVYAYFNNDWEGFAVRNAERLRTLLTRRRSTTVQRSRSRTASRRRAPAAKPP
jgi:uncharacterized protein YecE (DUF72 family)